MSVSKSFQDLIVWQRAHQLVLSVYKYTSTFPKEERYCLTSQFRRAATSIAANIAEGFPKRTKPDKIRILNIAQGSLEECRYYILLSTDLGYGADKNMGNYLKR
ncbi:MAG TPA: four helix bundle protein [Ohtaekwangia sp.]|uniref:four helix bundle protein n=1 Tax=Ohtaekwangia sp. TaxID=2066019 RepID=UPI002F93B7CB